MPDTIDPPQYEPQALTRKVDSAGWITFKGRDFRCSRAFAGQHVALRTTQQDGVFNLCYRSHVLSQVDLRENIAKPVLDVSERLSSMSPV